MKIANFNQDRIGIIDGADIVDVSDLISYDPGAWPPTAMLRLIASFTEFQTKLIDRASSPARQRLKEVKLNCPLTWPNKVIAFPANYRAHIAEMRSDAGLISKYDASGQGFFLKANSSLSGPRDPIVVPPLTDREVHHECELAVIIGRGGRNIERDRALNYVFGYACLVDVVVRGKEERVMRKSFDTFCPLGPYITTADEISDHNAIDLELQVNGELRQKANTRDLIVGIPEMIEMASSVMTLYPGDVIASGTPSGVGPIRPGDVLTIRIAGVGEMSLDVRAGQGSPHQVWHKSAIATSS